jgi:stage II sporulation protein B
MRRLRGDYHLDKQKTITIKINGKDRPYKKDGADQDKAKEQGEDVFRPKVSSWKEMAASKEPAEESFEWILPDPVEKIEAKQQGVSKAPKKPKQLGVRLPAINKGGKFNGVLPRVFLTILVAVVLGSGFGLIVLKTIKSGPAEEAAPLVKQPAQTAETPAGTGGASVELPAISTFVVQGGAWSTSELAEAAVKDLEGKGFNAVAVPSNDKFAVLLAAAGSLDEAKTMGSELESKGAEVYSRAHEIPAGSLASLTKEESEVLKLAPALFQALVSGSADDDGIKKAQDQLSILQSINQKNINNKDIVAVKKHLEQGTSAFLAYQTSKSENDRNTLQQENLAFLASWQALGK